MIIADGIYGLPQTLALGETEETIYPVAIETEFGLCLIDVGLPDSIATIEQNLEEHDYTLSDIEYILFTHQDFDHCGGAGAVLERTDATVMAHEADAPAIDGREQPIKGDDRYPAVDVDIELVGGETLQMGDHSLELIHTPGHTPGHLSVLVDDDLLIAGDAVNKESDGFAGPRERFTPDMETATASVHRLSFRNFETVHCFHGGTLEATEEDVKAIADDLAAGFRGFEHVSAEGPVKFLRQELQNEDVGLSVFEIPAGQRHGAPDDPDAGHRHAEQTEIYYIHEGTGTFTIGSTERSYEHGDAFLVKPYKYRRIEAEQDTEVFVAGAPVGDEAEQAEL